MSVHADILRTRSARTYHSGGPIGASAGAADRLSITADCKKLDRKGGLSADTRVDLSLLRRRDIGPRGPLPGKATITLDLDDMAGLDQREEQAVQAAQTEAEKASVRKSMRRFLCDLIAHEIGHALGLSRDVWERKGFLKRTPATNTPVFVGPSAMSAFGRALNTGPMDVPLETFGDGDKFVGHWRQAVFHSELMTFLLEDNPNLIGPVTVAALQDLGYEVNAGAAETDGVDLGSRPSPAPTPSQASPGPVHRLLRDHRWINCRVLP